MVGVVLVSESGSLTGVAQAEEFHIEYQISWLETPTHAAVRLLLAIAKAGAWFVSEFQPGPFTACWGAHDVPFHVENQILSVGVECPFHANHSWPAYQVKAGAVLVPAV